MLRSLAFALLAATIGLPAFAESDVELITRAESFSSSDGAPLKSYLNKLKGPKPDNGTYVLSRNNIDFGMAWEDGVRGGELTFFHRNDYNLSFHEDTLDFAFRNNNKQWDIPLDKEYQVDVVANQYQVTGVKLGQLFTIKNNIRVFVAGSYMHATEAVSGYLGKAEDGSGGVVSKTRVQIPFTDRYIIDLKGNLHTEYYFTDDPLFRLQVDPPTGDGYSIDFGVSWQLNQNLIVDLRIDDALGKIFWDEIPYTTADATSDRFVEDENGVWQANASYEGRLEYRKFRQNLTKRTRLSAEYSLDQYQLAYEYDDMGIGGFHYLSVGYQISQKWGVESAIEILSGSLGFTLRAPIGDLHLMLDSLNFDQAHNLGFGWSIHIPLL